MKAIVIGGSGATGRALVEQLLSTGGITGVTALLRRESFAAHARLNQVIVDFDRLDDYASYITGDVAFSCMGTTIKAAGSQQAQWKVDYEYQLKFAELARKNNIPTFVLVSSMNANADSMFFYPKMKGKLEESIRKLPFERLIIFQPGILERPDSDRTLENMAVSVTKGLNKIGLLKKHRPTPVSELAKAMINSITVFKPGVNIIKEEQVRTLAGKL